MGLDQGLLQVYTGDGKGKTTAAIGAGIRAIGAGYKVCMIQFMKGRKYHELNTLESLAAFSVEQYGRDEFVDFHHPAPEDIQLAQQGWMASKQYMKSRQFDVIILDEILTAIYFGLLDEKEIISSIQSRPKSVELILTGRQDSTQMKHQADIVTEMKNVKHCYQKGITNRKGFDW